jgi:hypothetical protein
MPSWTVLKASLLWLYAALTTIGAVDVVVWDSVVVLLTLSYCCQMRKEGTAQRSDRTMNKSNKRTHCNTSLLASHFVTEN